MESINSLLEKAKNEIPKEYWSKTPLILKATAGLRLLPVEKAENLLNSVRELFKSTPFLTNDHSVSIMDGVDEGIFSWFTVNFLLGMEFMQIKKYCPLKNCFCLQIEFMAVQPKQWQL